MSSQNIAETQRLIKFVEKYPFVDEEKEKWLVELRDNGINADLLEEIRKKFLEMPVEKVGGDWQRAQENRELMSIQKQWRLSMGSRNFRHSR